MRRLVEIVRSHRHAPTTVEPPEILIVAPPPLCETADPEIAAPFRRRRSSNRRCWRASTADLADESGCGFFDAGSVARTTPLDGVHLDADNTRAIGEGLEPARPHDAWDLEPETMRKTMADNTTSSSSAPGPGGYVAAIRAGPARHEDGHRRARAHGRHLLELGLHPDQGAAALGRNLRPLCEHAKDYGLTLEEVTASTSKAVVERSRGIAAQMNNGVRFLMKKNKVDIIWGEAMLTKPGEIKVVQVHEEADASRSGRRPRTRWARAPTRPSTSSSPPARARACCPASSRTAS